MVHPRRYVRLDENPRDGTRIDSARGPESLLRRFLSSREIDRRLLATSRNASSRPDAFIPEALPGLRGGGTRAVSRARGERAGWPGINTRARLSYVALDQLLGKTKHSRAALRHRVRRRRALSFARFSSRATPSFIGNGQTTIRPRLSPNDLPIESASQEPASRENEATARHNTNNAAPCALCQSVRRAVAPNKEIPLSPLLFQRRRRSLRLSTGLFRVGATRDGEGWPGQRPRDPSLSRGYLAWI